MEILKALNDKQREAVETKDGPVLILAGAGSGKTRALTHRIAYLIASGVSPDSILAVTFTNKAAEEMKKRVAKLLDSRFIIHNSGLFIGTFHSFGLKILRNEIHHLGYKKNFAIYDEDDSLSLAKEILKDMNLSPDQFKPASMLNKISDAKNELIGPEEFEIASNFYQKQIKQFYDNYQNKLKTCNALDFDDLIRLPVKIFSGNESILEKYQNQYRYILVDEYQDTNHAQYRLINLLAQKNRNLCVIGDPDQSIYTWRGADFRNILNFEKDYPDAKVIMLEQNYRSTQNILNAAREIISKNIERKEKTLWTENPPGEIIEVVATRNERDEAEAIINKVTGLHNALKVGLDEMAIMYRTNAQSRVLEEACLYANIPYRVIGAVRFYQRREVKDILAFLRLLQNENDSESAKRITTVLGKRGFASFKSDYANLKDDAKSLKPADVIKAVIKKIKYQDYLKQKFSGVAADGEPEYESRMRNLQELIGLAMKYDAEIQPEEALSNFLAEVALMQEPEKNDPNVKKLNLMTLHSAKGLEFEAVLIAGLEEGLFPHSRAAFSARELEEERRLCYVGITRAKRYLWLLFALKRSIWGSTAQTQPSRFLSELPSHLVNFRLYDDYEDSSNLPGSENWTAL
ncbi:hypothetical protein A2833_01805 [Candidatus Azambacteria bacterium RIFCSPHIGHO2_01_FULL_44_55]|nr:MAG: hypothetical protein A3A18_01025 [Candidatus Azambacteria bacterium RIFCSPLOWO2_01_FULL_44_84]OGD33006.1 MAG: hypothetical protein A3C78_01340 [Candidatus Azambacteria bacterium RIFCSPHIGHO2_02_FULL_45_18]OGD39824.1 MAG: hypothetical protein A2833_01805 [Candidatus Azambacteria bacterium RIFCSPHIGHO2_01_FULL_44_55]